MPKHGLANTISVFASSGVDTTGATNATSAIQALINAAGTNTVFDFGDTRHSYKIGSLVMKSGHTYRADGALITHLAGSTEGIFTYKDVTVPRVSITDVLIEGFTFQGEVAVAAETERSAVYIYSGTRIVVRDCVAYDFKSAAFHVQEAGDVTYDNLRAYRCSNYSGVAGRNAIEILGSQDTLFSDTADVSHTWTIKNCKADNAGSPGGGAGGVCMIANDAQNIRGHMDGNWAYNCLNFAGIVAEAGFTKYSTITNNKAFCCLVGIYNVDTQSDHGTGVVVQDRLHISGNIVDAKNVTTSTPANSGATITVAPGADLPGAIGMDLMPSHSTITGNVVRATSDGIKLRGNATTSVRATATILASNQVTMANQNAATSVFGFYLNRVSDLQITGNHVEREIGVVSTATTNATTTLASVTPTTGWVNGMYVTGPGIPAGTTVSSGAGTGTMIMSAAATTSGTGVTIKGGTAVMKDAYYLDDVTGVSWEGNSSRDAGRAAIRLVANVSVATFNGGFHIDPAATESAEGILVAATTGMSDLHFGGGMVVKDTRSVMTYGLNVGAGALPLSTTGEMSLVGWVTSAINGVGNMAVDQLRLHVEDKGAAPRTFGQNTQRRGRHTGVPSTSGWSLGDRLENTSSAAGATGEWGCSASGNPGTWRPLYTIPGIATVATDADLTLTAGTDKPTLLHTGTLTATRSITLATTSNVVLEGHKFRVTRTGAGAFNLQVGTGPLKSLATNQWCDVEYDGGNWKLTAFGSL